MVQYPLSLNTLLLGHATYGGMVKTGPFSDAALEQEDEYVSSVSSVTSTRSETSLQSPNSESAPVAGRGILFPIEIWRVIFDMVGDESNKHVTADMLSILYTCTSFKLEAENVLYRRVSLTRSVSQLYAFVASINEGPWRALAVQSLRLYMPDLRPEDDIVKGLFQKLVNLVDLHVSGLGSPDSILIPSPFRLHTCRMNWDAFLQIHSEANGHAHHYPSSAPSLELESDPNQAPDDASELVADSPNSIPTEEKHGSSSSDPASPRTPVPLAVLAPLHTLTLIRPSSLRSGWEGSRTLFRHCGAYHITHLNLVLVPSRAIPRDALRALGPHLVAFRTSLGRAGWGSTSALSDAPHLWPTQIVHGVALPRLKHLELCEELQNYYDAEEGKTREQQAMDDVNAWRAACPVISTFVWRPALYHRTLAEGDSWYAWAMRDYTDALFMEWPTLERFERLRLEREEVDGREEDAEAAPYVAYVRNGFGRVVASPAVYDDDLWRRA
ncbi:hypothetical protein C8Q76DRAFT_688189 [Earliella scabrosa]|nr:hypothetical protein C8Q76DRAFT_688189 [Earliella scabrosa]